VIPALQFIPRERHDIIGEANVEVRPDLVAEKRSPATCHKDLLVKRTLYARAGVRKSWLIKPATNSIFVLALESDRYTEVLSAETGTVTSPVLLGLRLALDNVFEAVDIAPSDDIAR
jgi:Uma2 family endonuclease